MKRFKVVIELANGTTKKFTKEYVVEAGTKKIAWVRAATEANNDGYGDYYKTIISCDEIEE